MNTSLPTENTKEQKEEEQKEEEEDVVIGAVEDSQLPDEGCVSVAPVPSEEEPKPGPHAHCQAWLLDMLDDVRYLISCTNWY